MRVPIILIIQITLVILLLIVFTIVYLEERRQSKEDKINVRLNKYWRGIERRKAVRIDASINVKYRVFKKSNSHIWHLTNSKNVSRTGICLSLYEKLRKGTQIKLDIDIPDNPKPIFAEAEIIWVKEIRKDLKEDGRRAFRTGIKFIQIDSQDEIKLREFIDKIIHTASIIHKPANVSSV